MSVGLVLIEVEGHHQLQVAERLGEFVAVGHRQNRIAGAHEQGLELSFARGEHLLGHHRGRSGAQNLRQIADPAAPSVPREPRDMLQRCHSQALSGDAQIAEHGSAGDVEVSGDEVDDVEQRGGEGACATQRRPDPAIDRGAVGDHQGAGQLAHGLGIDARAIGGHLGSETGGQLFDRLETGGLLGQLILVGELLGEHDVQERQEQQRVGIRDDRLPFELAGGLGAARVDHQYASTAVRDGLQAFPDTR